MSPIPYDLAKTLWEVHPQHETSVYPIIKNSGFMRANW